MIVDWICLSSSGSYRYMTWFKGEPRTAIFAFLTTALALCMVVFYAVLLRNDKWPPVQSSDDAPAKLGFAFSLDTFHPFHQLRMSKSHGNTLPGNPALQRYLKVHRVIGTVLSIALAAIFYFGAN